MISWPTAILISATAISLSTSDAADDALPLMGRCGSLSAVARANLEAFGATFSEDAARVALRAYQERLATVADQPAQSEPSTAALAATLEGWLIKKAWLSARARREHDVDEAIAFCEFLLAAPTIGYAVATERRPVYVAASFAQFEALNADFMVSVANGQGATGKSHRELRSAVERYAEGPFAVAIRAARDVVCENGNAGLVQAFLQVMAATSNSADEAPADMLREMASCQPTLVTTSFRSLPADAAAAICQQVPDLRFCAAG